MLKKEQNNTTTSPSESNAQGKMCTIERYVGDLAHACKCLDKNCQLSGCVRMKQVMRHIRTCQIKGMNCVICKKLAGLCFYHAKRCQKTICDVPVCWILQQRIKDPGFQHSRELAQLCREIASIHL